MLASRYNNTLLGCYQFVHSLTANTYFYTLNVFHIQIKTYSPQKIIPNNRFWIIMKFHFTKLKMLCETKHSWPYNVTIAQHLYYSGNSVSSYQFTTNVHTLRPPQPVVKCCYCHQCCLVLELDLSTAVEVLRFLQLLTNL